MGRFRAPRGGEEEALLFCRSKKKPVSVHDGKPWTDMDANCRAGGAGIGARWLFFLHFLFAAEKESGNQ